MERWETVRCPWCGARVEVRWGRSPEVYCGQCGHNAAVAPGWCDCDWCEANAPEDEGERERFAAGVAYFTRQEAAR
jgi:hypothetical protein